MYPRTYHNTQLKAPPIIPTIPPSLVARRHHTPRRKGKVNADAIKLKAFQGTDIRFADIDYQKIEDETVFTISLILDGISNTK